MTRQAKIRLTTDGVVAGYLRDISRVRPPGPRRLQPAPSPPALVRPAYAVVAVADRAA
jgi:hypothetical protein